jgi:membrane-bound lytic murein transglycosylase A
VSRRSTARRSSTSSDPVEAFFLEIQGSGRIKLDDGSVMRVGYADQNGHPYRSIGTVLIERGELTLGQRRCRASAHGAEESRQAAGVARRESELRVLSRGAAARAGHARAQIDGPFGSLGVPLLRERTLAVDTRAIPLGAPVYLATTYPLSTRPLQR